MKRIAIDFHNTLANLSERVLQMYNGEYAIGNGREYTQEDWTDWKVWEVIPMKKEKFWDYIGQINTCGINAKLNPVEPDLAEKLTRLISYYPQTEILTAMPHSAAKDVVGFLKAQGLPTLRVNTVGVPKAQGEAKFEYPFDVWIDDNPYMVGKTPSDGFLILYDQPWNRAVHCNEKNEFRAKNWEEVIRLCHQIQNIL